jgi:transcriptional regulator with XRE-family HTH domain
MRTQKQFQNRKRLLEEAGITYSDIARLANVSWNMVWRWMHGQRTSAKVQAAFDRLVNTRV